ncbi:Phosphoribosylformylglycinamidine cyclo-ligase [uncultured archaeon]|nr:Phosphoribosylformylglycinamidine cyclo-ligase [uncultured archaeon]
MVSYEEAGVSIDAGNDAEERIGNTVKGTYNKMVLSGVGGFGAVYSLAKVRKMKNPLLVSTVDGVGTKMKVAALMGKFDTVGQDIVNHCSNDLLAMGAEPLFFLDYIAAAKITPARVEEIVKGMAEACKKLDCPLVGGETAEMPGVYLEGEHDVVGMMVGVVDRKNLFDPMKISRGDVLIGLASSGLHTNGFSLARKVLFDKAGYKATDYISDLGCTIGEALLVPHRSYSKNILALRGKVKVKGGAHITGGGLNENVPRIMPPKLQAAFNHSAIEFPPLFKFIQRLGHISNDEMYRTFNVGIGLVAIVSRKDAKKAIAFLTKAGEKARVIGEAGAK